VWAVCQCVPFRSLLQFVHEIITSIEEEGEAAIIVHDVTWVLQVSHDAGART
jgi:hypothetical protein